MPSLPTSRTGRASAATLMAATLCISLGGCQVATGPGASLAADPSDPCQSQRAAFAASKTYFQDQIVSGAVTGAAIGAGLGALTGLASGGNARAALTGGLIGGALGGVAGAGTAYYNTLSQRAADQDAVANAMNQDLVQEGAQIDHTTATFAQLRACRFGQAQFVKNQARRHELDRPTALARIGYHRDKFDEEIRIAHEFGLTMARRDQQFQEAANDLRSPPPPQSGSAIPAPARTAAPARIAQVNRAASVSVPEKRQSFDSTVASAETHSKAAFDLDSNASLSWLLTPGLDG